MTPKRMSIALVVLLLLGGAGFARGEDSQDEQIDMSKGGTYESGKWKYELIVRAPGTRSEMRKGTLSYDKKPLPEAEDINDYYETPWGKMYWVGETQSRWGDHGWMPEPSKRFPDKEGEKLTPPGEEDEPAAESPPGEEPEPVKLTSEHDGKTVEAVVGQEIIISLEGNATTGYRWLEDRITGKAVKLQGEPEYETDADPVNPRPGQGGRFIITLKAVRAGKSKIELIYARPWQRNRPGKDYSVTVEVKASATEEKIDAQMLKEKLLDDDGEEYFELTFINPDVSDEDETPKIIGLRNTAPPGMPHPSYKFIVLKTGEAEDILDLLEDQGLLKNAKLVRNKQLEGVALPETGFRMRGRDNHHSFYGDITRDQVTELVPELRKMLGEKRTRLLGVMVEN
jgi:predicted secreted protein